MSISNSTVIIADDLTGANDTALQFFKSGATVKIMINPDCDYNNEACDDVLSFSTESRNIDKETAVQRIIDICENLSTNFNVENFYKKIDSTLRGNVGLEIIAMLEVLKKDAAIITPAYIEENRTTIGGYQLLNGIPIERSQMALDPKAPITNSYIPDILKEDINETLYDLIDVVGFDIVTKGAGPIILKIKELIQKGKRLIITDAMSVVDVEQIALAINKSGFNLLPVGSAGLANSINKIKNDGIEEIEHITHCPKMPKLIISGSATQLTKNQIEKLKEQKTNLNFIDLKIKDIVENNYNKIAGNAIEKILEDKDVVIHSSSMLDEIKIEESANCLIDAGIAKSEFPNMITDFLSKVIFEINLKTKFILILIGGETSFKCLSTIDSKYLQIVDAILPAIPLCIDGNGNIIVTKSGNFGNLNTLNEILNYFERLN